MISGRSISGKSIASVRRFAVLEREDFTDCVITTVPFESRNVKVPFESRSVTVRFESRSVRIPFESRKVRVRC